MHPSLRHHIDTISPLVKSITPAAAQQARDSGAIFIDVREPHEYQEQCIDGALHIPRGLLEFAIWQNEQCHCDAEIILFCQFGYRGLLATYALQQLGFSHVSNLEGGLDAWQAELGQH